MRQTIAFLAVTAMIPALLVGSTAPTAIAAGHHHTPGVVDTTTGMWHLWDPLLGEVAFYYGDPGDVPFVGDWNCDGVETPGLFRLSDAFVYLRNSNTQGNADIRFFFGNPNDLPLAGDFNGDGCDTVSLYRPAESRVFIINELGADEGGLGAADFDYVFGDPGDTPFVGDFDGDGIDTIGLHRESTGRVYFRNRHTQGNADADFIYGDPGDLIVAGDWNGDGTDSVGIYRAGSSLLHLNYRNAPTVADETIIMDVDSTAALPVAGALDRTGMVSFADYGCGSMSEYTGSSFEALPPSPAPFVPSDAEGFYGMSFTRGPNCDRVVITLAAQEDPPGLPAASSVPAGVEVSVEGNRVHVDTPTITWGAGAPTGLPTFLAEPFAFLVRSGIPGSTGHYVDVHYPDYRIIRAWYLSDPARIVVDSRPAAAPPGVQLGPVLGDRLHLRDAVDPLGAGIPNPAHVLGYARPFEGDDGAGLTDSAGMPVDATWWGCDTEFAGPGGCVYRASDQGPTWGEFGFTIADLPPGTYRLDVSETSPLETDPGGVVTDTFTITGPGSCSADGLLDAVETALGASPGDLTLWLGRCAPPYGWLYAQPTQAGLESEQMFMKEVGGAWTVLTFGTGIDCFTDTTFDPPELETACEALGLR